PLALLRAGQLGGEAGHLRCVARHRHPTAPSICSSIRRFNSSAYSMGSSRAMGSTNPRTTMAIASPSVRPRLIRENSWSSLTLATVASWPIDTSSVRTSTYGYVWDGEIVATRSASHLTVDFEWRAFGLTCTSPR